MALRHLVRGLLLAPLLAAAAACVPQDGAPKAASAAVSPASAQQATVPAAPPAPATASAARITTDLTVPQSSRGMATYRCNGGTISIQNLGTSLRVAGPDGWTEEFAASPANQSSRYQAATTHDAVVIDGREALLMKKGSTPLTCRR
ncbi:MAG: hypothetical protein EOS58_04805 [Mesorhizobium sp.]|nr:hypothetical protein [Mesorhizobium sp.]RVD72421.1 hypothetical protein EN751_10225 [Mesorhizobium sp. M4A.F.Ca.ET.029.04.2.1]RWD06346.1 MAG: hypothetical protein EOS58_04805 [Mesorhizobium sp.]TIW36742.1 MAG: hypothetical protein E5V62_05115 [Mesorhizobium sp.]